ncbi:GNAT family N-acetyltransferase [Candidatus Bathyarchaeota archaeon]|nr:MAG: GNAT family N-acetyltransferase [Candidatus Bathyarchaeota archaeon]
MIRQMELGEEDKVRRLLSELSFEDQTLWRKQAKPLEEYLEKYSKIPISHAVEGKNAIFVEEEEGKIIGLCWCTLVDRGIDRQGEIAEFYIEEEHRGKGIRKELLETAKQFFTRERAEVVFVWTHHGNEAAIELYKNAGFKEVTQIVMAYIPA